MVKVKKYNKYYEPIMDVTMNNYFVPKYFVIHMFYGVKTCFCWNEEKLLIFPYAKDNFTPDVLRAPAPIKTIQCFSDRIFLICIPRGIYKLSKVREFAVLSKSAIGMGTVLYEVLVPKDKYLYLDNKQNTKSNVLFQLSSEDSDSSKLFTYPLNVENVMEHFMNTLRNNDSTIENVCIIGEGNKLLVLMNETVQIIYNSVYSIRDIIPVQKNSKIIGLFLLTTTDTIILMYSKNNVLIFEPICLRIQIEAICAQFSQLFEDTVWIAYSDGSKLYYAKKELLKDNIQRMEVQDKSFSCLQSYDSKVIVGLTMNKELVELSIDSMERALFMENDVLINLHRDMFKSAELITHKIYEGTQKLHVSNEILMTEEDKLRKINLYAHKYKMKLYPKIFIRRIANQSFLSANFHDTLPKNSWIIVNMKLDSQNIFYMKKVIDLETIVDIYIPEGKMINFSQITIDLITLKDKRYPWCLIKNYVIDPCSEKSKKIKTRSDKINFIKSKIDRLQSLIRDGNINMKVLSDIKKDVRKEFSDV